MKKSKKITIIGIIAAVLIGSVAGVLAYKHRNDQIRNKAADKSSETRGINTIDYSGPTEQEQSAANDQKEQNARQQEIESHDPDTKATVLLVDSSQYGQEFEVRAYVSDIFENGGTCTATFTKAGFAAVTQSSTGSTSAKTTQCGTITIPVEKFAAKGEWQLIVNYASPAASGSSQPKIVNIQ